MADDLDVADGFYSPRELTYIEPAGRRLSDYESVICHVQPDIHHYDAGGWLLLSPYDQGLFEESSTRVRHPDWFEYRDPSSLWQRTYTRQQATAERATANLFESAANDGCFEEIDDFWARDILARYHQGFAFAEWGVFLALTRSIRLALSDTITMMLIFTAVDRLRHQQAIAVFGLELEQRLGNLREGAGREAWLNDAAFQPARAVVEKLATVEDWCEVAVVCGLLLDPLLYGFVVRHFLRRFAPLNGDAVTPVLALTAERDRDRYRAAIVALVQMVLATADRKGRPVPDVENRGVLQEWIDEWAPLVLAAVDAFAPVYDLPTMRPQTAETARKLVVEDCQETLERLGLELTT
jgi:hypothetical protein